jgi:hypothetical protein
LSRAREYVVVGAGISGLYAALLLARRGRSVRVIERAHKSGGLAGSTLFRGLPCDLGSHRLHPEALDRPLFREMHAERPLLSRPRRGVLVLGDRHIPYPPTALSLAQSIGLRASASMALGLLTKRERRAAFAGWERGRGALGSAGEEDVGFERFVTARVGEAAYLAFYKPYAEKVWGIAPSELSQAVAKKRVSSTSPLRLLQSFAGRAASIATGRPRLALGTFVYPPGGTSSIAAFIEDRLASLGVRVEHGAPLCAQGARSRELGETILFAGDLEDLAPGAGLEHRGLYLVYLALGAPRVGVGETYYSPDPRYWFGRVSELQNYSPELRRPGETVLCVEIPEGSWGRSVDFASGPKLSELLAQLARARIAPPSLPLLEVRQRFLPNVYPLYRRGFRAAWGRAMARVAELGNVVPFGRQALFLHCNIDHCADIAESAVAYAEAAEQGATPGDIDLTGWFEQAAGFLELTVRD